MSGDGELIGTWRAQDIGQGPEQVRLLRVGPAPTATT